MNLHEHSQAYNWEMGIRFTKNEDLAIYDATFDEVQMIVKQSKENPKIKFVNPAARSQKFTPGPVPPKNNSNSELKPNNNYASTSETLTFGNKELGINYAGFWLRLAAAVIDGLILLIPFVICVVISGTNPLIFYFLIWIVGFAYFAYLESSPKMATFGKEAMGLIVTNMDGSQLTFKQASIRYIGKLLSLVILYGGFIMIGFTEKKQGLHDMIAKTLVVKK